ncbi:MAG: FHA domain-containing protein [Bacteroidales bacterium]|nr:FHA domain-containing protein [Bacteroidales bacterium]
MGISIRHILTIIIAISAMAAMGQDLRILSISDGNYPEILVRARLQDSQDDSLYIYERGEAVLYDMQESEISMISREGRMYVFLVENSYSFFHNGIFPSIKKTIQQTGDNLKKTDNVNILYFGAPGRNVRYLSAEQTSDMELMSGIVADVFEPQTDSSFIENRLVSAIEEALDYCKKHQKSMETVILTIVSRGLNLDNSKREFSHEFKETLQKSGIYLNVLTYRSEAQNIKRELEDLAQATAGSFTEFTKADIEKTMVQSIEKMSKAKARNFFREVVITFNAAQNGVRNSFLIKYGNTEARCEYTNPNKSGFLGKYPIAVSVLISLLIVLLAVGFYIKTKEKIIKKIDSNTQTHFKDLQRQNRILKQEIEKYKKHPLSLNHSFDNIYIEETLIGSGKIIPKLQVEDHGKHDVYKITKLTVTIGRSEGNDIVIENRTVSGHHATLTNEGGFFYITDNESTNGLFVNDIRIITKYKLKPKDRIRIGSVMAQLVY